MLDKLSTTLQTDEPINIQFTSGTTGQPKGATLTHHNLLNNAYFAGRRFGFHEGNHRLCLPVPFYHCFGMGLGNLQIIAHNTTCVNPAPSFEPEATLRAVHEERATALYGTPTMFIDQLNHPNFQQYDLSSLDTGMIAGAPCPMEVKRKILHNKNAVFHVAFSIKVMKRMISDMHMKHVTIGYGSTENSPLTFQGLREDSLEKRIKQYRVRGSTYRS